MNLMFNIKNAYDLVWNTFPWMDTLTEPLATMYQDLPSSPWLNTAIEKTKS